jgi:predicted nuclease of restriction endonuclease-like (RecB) superfamily
MSSEELAVPFVPFVEEIREILLQARHKAYASTNLLMVEAYWRVGQRIVEEEQQGAQRAEYGAQLVKQLARQLDGEFGNGVSIANLKNFRQFYLTFPEFSKSYTARSFLTWSHWRLIMRVDGREAREFYIREVAERALSTRDLAREISTSTFQRILEPPTASDLALRADPKPQELVKDPYILEFLGLPDGQDPSERELEGALVRRLRDFMLELGKGFSFVGSQVRISSETSHFYVDLVFYNYLLKCFVLLDLKTHKLTHADIGQMDMYVRMFDDLKRGDGDSPTVGIILCTDKDDTVVRYSVLKENPQLFASKYRLVLPSEEELRDELDRRQILQLPTPNSNPSQAELGEASAVETVGDSGR